MEERGEEERNERRQRLSALGREQGGGKEEGFVELDRGEEEGVPVGRPECVDALSSPGRSHQVGWCRSEGTPVCRKYAPRYDTGRHSRSGSYSPIVQDGKRWVERLGKPLEDDCSEKN